MLYVILIYIPALFILENLKIYDIGLIKPKSFELFIFSLISSIIFWCSVFIYNLENFFIKYWLYCSKDDIFYVFQ